MFAEKVSETSATETPLKPSKVATVNDVTSSKADVGDSHEPAQKNGDLTNSSSNSSLTNTSPPPTLTSTPSPPLPKPRKQIPGEIKEEQARKVVAESDGDDVAEDGGRDVSC